MPNQRESNINDFAFDYLCSHYITRFGTKKVLVDKEERTKQGHITQGLFSLKKHDDTLFVAALHTAHSPQITKALTRFKKNGLSRLRFVSALLVLAAVSVAGWLILKSITYALTAAVALAVLTFALHSVLEKRYHTQKITRLLDELKKTPADEQWLGLSVSSLVFRHNYLAKHLLALCERRGIGLITVGQRAKIVLLKEAQTSACRRGDFLSHYQSDERIRKALLGDSVLRVA
ncbi:hypothetical protein POKO110462_13910 [Pontibacter korlensis]|uniref:Uncharacterized protein n=1 Tax=Pontibacter korlensis TaxID=400092 RepID=A0A0E3ZDZ9_9BACT|nr:hypothetical protein [Pontibacter korlensis]AKD02005.1 hypothetical protein PKOR_01180 [Pontibacter korlensis]